MLRRRKNMEFLIKPENRRAGGCSCNCAGNQGSVNYKPCNGDCPRLTICVSPTGIKYSPNGLGTAS